MSRLCPTRADVALGLGVVIAMLGVALSGVQAVAQAISSMDSAFSPPEGNWDPSHPPRFQKRATFGNPPGYGAAKTGFDSTNTRGKTKKAGKNKTGAAARPLAPVVTSRAAPVSAPPPISSPPPVTGNTSPPVEAAPVTTGTIKPPKKKPVEAEPYGALGMRVGSFLLFPAIELAGGYDSNPARETRAAGSSLYVVAPELLVRSDWKRHDLRAEIRGSYTGFNSQPSLNRPSLTSKVDGRFDVSSQTQIDVQSRFLLATDNPGSPNLQASVAKAPFFTTTGGTAAVAHRFNRAELQGSVSIDRTSYQDSVLTDGKIASNADRNFSQYGMGLRGSYEFTPGFKPFVQVDTDSRVHDVAVDRTGIQRDSKGFTPRVGTSFEFTRLLTGNVSVGYLTRSYKDPALQELRGVIADASLIWSATALTTATLTAKSSADETTLSGASGILSREFGLQVDHSFRRWLIATLKFGYGFDDFPGLTRQDQRYWASAALIYKLTRSVQVKGEVRQESRTSNIPGNDYSASIFLIGMRLQR
ncbi:MAG: hypothetical protein QOJ96_271 [Alphaproteobacteria bacterium]|nr:hypothetical protein [Alphaproteobacteria bacterium]